MKAKISEVASAVCADAGWAADFASGTLLESALERCRAAAGMDWAEYGDRLAGDTLARDALLEELLVRESWFWRDVRPFTWFGAWLTARGWPARGALKVLSAPCAHGEEPYSIALLAEQSGIALANLQIDAIDLSRIALERAQAGVYRARALQALPADVVQQYFADLGNGRFALEPRVRNRVRFRRGNLAVAGEVSRDGPYDAIFCRNLLIYLAPEVRTRLLEELTACLEPGGVLIVGHAEAGLLRGRPFAADGDGATFAFTRLAPTPARGSDAAQTAPAVSRIGGRRRPRELDVATAPAPAAVSTTAGAGLAEAQRLADSGRYSAAMSLAKSLQRDHPPVVECEHLIGLLHAAEGEFEHALRAFQRALYLDPKHLPTIEQLALLLERRGDSARARRLRRRAAAFGGGR